MNPTHEVIEKLEKLKAWMVSLLAGEPPIPTLEVKLALKRVEAALALLQPVATPVGPSTLVEEGVRTMTAHELKIWPVYFQAVIEGRKTFEVRRNDRDFKVGDTLRLREFNPENGGSYTGREVCRAIAYLSEFAQELGYVVLALSTAPAGEARLRELAGEFVDYWTGENEARVRRIGAEAASGCGMCGGIPHSTTCFVGRFQALLTAALVPHCEFRGGQRGGKHDAAQRIEEVWHTDGSVTVTRYPAPVQAEKECAYGHRRRVVGCGSCVLVFDWQAEKERTR